MSVGVYGIPARRHPKMDRVCINCGKRYGKHCGKLAWCWIEDAKLERRAGDKFADSGALKDANGHVYEGESNLAANANPNIAFRFRKSK